MEKVKVELSHTSYEIIISPGLLKNVPSILKEMGFSGKAVIVTDSRVNQLYGSSLKQALTKSGFDTLICEIPQGEDQKSLETAGSLYQKLTDFHAERLTPLLALGGGVIGDLTGFVAATYMRGVPLIQIPTTVLSQSDSSIGGKTAVNYGKLKNRVGAFYHPRLTIADISVLKTLSERETSDGLAEVIKHGVILDAAFFDYLEANMPQIRAHNEAVLEKVVSRSAAIKAGVVMQDELDLGIRNILNFGHTIGHAIETVSALKIWHGEAVGIGMLVEADLSVRLGKFSERELARLEKVIHAAGLPTRIPSLPVDAMMSAMLHDKKITDGKVKFILPSKIGEVFITDSVSQTLVREAILDWNE